MKTHCCVKCGLDATNPESEKCPDCGGWMASEAGVSDGKPALVPEAWARHLYGELAAIKEAPIFTPIFINNLKIRVTKLCVLPPGDPIFSELCTEVSIDDEAGGEYVQVKQLHDRSEPGTIFVDDKCWPAIKLAIETLLEQCGNNP